MRIPHTLIAKDPAQESLIQGGRVEPGLLCGTGNLSSEIDEVHCPEGAVLCSAQPLLRADTQ